MGSDQFELLKVLFGLTDEMGGNELFRCEGKSNHQMWGALNAVFVV